MMEENGQSSLDIEKDVSGIRYESRIRRVSNIPIAVALILEILILFGIQVDSSVHFPYGFIVLTTVFLMHQYYALIFSLDPVLAEASDKREYEYRRYKRYEVPVSQIK